MADGEFFGIALENLRIDFVDWSGREAHIRTRSRRRPGDLDVEPEWATEAAVADANRIVSTRGSKSGRSIRVVGWSPGAGRLLTVILVPKDLGNGEWWGATAWASNEQDARAYEETE